MIEQFVQRFDEKRSEIRAHFAAHEPDAYIDIVKAVVEALADDDAYRRAPDPNRIHQIDDGDYQGTLVFVIGATGYQPSTYWCVTVDYGSCSGCDTLQAIREECSYSEDGTRKTTEPQLDQYMTLALHIAQRIKEIS